MRFKKISFLKKKNTQTLNLKLISKTSNVKNRKYLINLKTDITNEVILIEKLKIVFKLYILSLFIV